MDGWCVRVPKHGRLARSFTLEYVVIRRIAGRLQHKWLSSEGHEAHET